MAELCAAPLVVAMGSQDVQRVVDPTTKELQYNPKYEELFAPVKGPDNPNLTDQMKAPRNTLAGYVEKAHISAFQFENQRRTFHTYGYALDPSVDGATTSGQSFVGDLQVIITFINVPCSPLITLPIPLLGRLRHRRQDSLRVPSSATARGHPQAKEKRCTRRH